MRGRCWVRGGRICYEVVGGLGCWWSVWSGVGWVWFGLVPESRADGLVGRGEIDV